MESDTSRRGEEVEEVRRAGKRCCRRWRSLGDAWPMRACLRRRRLMELARSVLSETTTKRGIGVRKLGKKRVMAACESKATIPTLHVSLTQLKIDK